MAPEDALKSEEESTSRQQLRSQAQAQAQHPTVSAGHLNASYARALFAAAVSDEAVGVARASIIQKLQNQNPNIPVSMMIPASLAQHDRDHGTSSNAFYESCSSNQKMLEHLVSLRLEDQRQRQLYKKIVESRGSSSAALPPFSPRETTFLSMSMQDHRHDRLIEGKSREPSPSTIIQSLSDMSGRSKFRVAGEGGRGRGGNSSSRRHRARGGARTQQRLAKEKEKLDLLRSFENQLRAQQKARHDIRYARKKRRNDQALAKAKGNDRLRGRTGPGAGRGGRGRGRGRGGSRGKGRGGGERRNRF